MEVMAYFYDIEAEQNQNNNKNQQPNNKEELQSFVLEQLEDWVDIMRS